MDTNRLLIILAAIAVLAIGAFYFVGPGSTPAEAPAPISAPATPEPTPTPTP